MEDEGKEIGVIGIGAMGGNIARLLQDGGYSLVLYNKTPEGYEPFRGKRGFTIAGDLADLVKKLGKEGDRVVWMMVPGGDVTNGIVMQLSNIMRPGDIVIDASNSIYTDSIANYNSMRAAGVSYLDVGCAGGPDDLLNGATFMIGGDKDAYGRAEGIFKTLAGKNGTYGYVGGSGSGQMTKMVHNGIFYGIFPVYAEGVELLQRMSENANGSSLDMKEALRLLARSPPITTDIMGGITKAHANGELERPAGAPKVSEMVNRELDVAASMGVGLAITKAVLGGYASMSERSRSIYTAAKRIVTGH